jgi:hypothetical protein
MHLCRQPPEMGDTPQRYCMTTGRQTKGCPLHRLKNLHARFDPAGWTIVNLVRPG